MNNEQTRAEVIRATTWTSIYEGFHLLSSSFSLALEVKTSVGKRPKIKVPVILAFCPQDVAGELGIGQG